MCNVKYAVILSVFTFFISLVTVDARQMCWSCQFVLNGRGEECTTAPGNWTGGDPRVKCPLKCIITAEYDAVTTEPTFFFRGCGESNQEDGCTDNGARHSCFFACEGEDYCNDQSLPKSPLVDNPDSASMLDTRLNLEKSILIALVSYIVVVLMNNRRTVFF